MSKGERMDFIPERKKRFGEICIDMGYANEEDIRMALEYQKQNSNLRTGEILEEAGVISTEQVAMILSKQFKMQYIDLSKFILDPNLIKEIGKKTVADLYFVPLKKIAGKLIVAIADPTDEEKLTKIKEAIQDEIVFVVSSTSSINKLLVNLVYEVKAEIEREEKAKIQAEENEEKISPQTPPATASTLKKEIFTRESVLEGGDIFEAVLNKLEKLKIPLTIYLKSGTTIQAGYLIAKDSQSIFLKEKKKCQLVRKADISGLAFVEPLN
jgi:sRNA-binding regulator protein Hfq